MAAILADDNSNAFSGMEKKKIAIRISLKFVPMNPIVHNAALV